MSDILTTILKAKREEVRAARRTRSEAQLMDDAVRAGPVRGFQAALQRSIETRGAAVVAEIKKGSPSKGLLRAAFDAAQIAASYAAGGASCLSVLTDQAFFMGSHSDLHAARGACSLPVLRKDFIIDAYQVLEARAMGADCILLIVAGLAVAQLRELAGLAGELGMDVLVEVHDEPELEHALTLEHVMIGINNRDLRTFHTDLAATTRMAGLIPNQRLVISESGIHQPEDLQVLAEHGVHAFLIGELFMRAADPGQALAALLKR